MCNVDNVVAVQHSVMVIAIKTATKNPPVLLKFDKVHRCTSLCACQAKGYLNAKKCSEPISALHCWLGSVFRAITAHSVHFFNLNFQKCSERVSHYLFCLGHVICATTACTFSTSKLPKVI